MEARDAAQHPIVYSMTPAAENDLAPDVSGASMGTETDQGRGGGHLGPKCREALNEQLLRPVQVRWTGRVLGDSSPGERGER